MPVYVTVEKRYLDGLAHALAWDGTDESLASALSEAAFFHATATLGSLPEEVKGKLSVEFSELSAGGGEVEAIVRYQMKPSAEGATKQTGQMFLPLDKLGNYSTRAPVISPSGESGIYITGTGLTGRPSIEKYLMSQAEKAIEVSTGLTLNRATELAKGALVQWFAANGVVYNASAARYQTTRTIEMPWGTTVPGGRFIVGDF